MKYKKTFFALAVIMAALGCNDSLRGVFLPIFASHFNLSVAQQGAIITVSYVGNVTFLLVGGRLLSRMPQKKAIGLFLSVWLASMSIMLLFDSYGILLGGIFCSLGASSMVGMLINLLTPQLTEISPVFFVNLLFFVQGFGTVGGQFVIGRYASSLFHWKIVNLFLLSVGFLAMLFVLKSPFPPTQSVAKEKRVQNKSYLKDKMSWLLIAVFGFYFIAEHSVFNWFIAYSTTSLGLAVPQAANYLALFSLGIMVGRLTLSLLIDKLGMLRCMLVFSVVGVALYVVGVCGGIATVLLWVLSGLFFSILYPTLVVSLGEHYTKQHAACAASVIISVASLFDIAFNLIFGKMVDINGYAHSIWVLPCCAVLFLALLALFAYLLKRNAAMAAKD